MSKPDTMPAERRKRSLIRPAYVILLVLMALFAFKFVQKTQEIRRLAAQEAALQYANRKTAQANARLASAIRYYRTPDYAAGEARAVFGYTEPGDVAIMSRPIQEPAVAVRAAPPRPPSPSKPVWKQWWDAFFG